MRVGVVWLKDNSYIEDAWKYEGSHIITLVLNIVGITCQFAVHDIATIIVVVIDSFL